ncbi:MAG: Cupin 2 conserved barrel domain protein [Ilumatobacteraceae bacterium]|nr:Cupin 2 conserved barrel domain protein [Ilumatobacteraceae bacterium]
MTEQGPPPETSPEPSKLGWVGDIERLTLDNDTFRTVVHTGPHAQLTVMCIPAGGEIGWEAHGHLDQFLRIEQGQGRLDLGTSEDTVDERWDVEDDWAIVVPAGTWHNVVNTGDEALKLYSVYSPPEHPAGTVHHTKEEADAAEAAEGH